MKFKQLNTFLLVADMQSLSRAAIASDTAQSLVSRQIAMLEAEWGRRLFDRTGRGMALSDFGRRMYPEVKCVVDQMCQLDASASEAAGVLTGTVHVGVLPSLSRQLLPMLLADVRELSAWRESETPTGLRYGQPFLPEAELAAYLVQVGLPDVPKLPPFNATAAEVSHEYVLDWLRQHTPHTQAPLPGLPTPGRAEGAILRTADRSAIVKIRFEDYERTLNQRGQGR